MRCPSCGQETSDQALYCPYCGSNLAQEAAKRSSRRRGVTCCLGAVGLFVLLLAVVVAGWWFLGRRWMTNRVIERLSVPLERNMDLSSLRGRYIDVVLEEEMVNQQLDQVVPGGAGAVGALNLEFYDTGMELQFRLYRLWNTLEIEAEAEDGHLRISRLEASPLLQWVILPDQIASYVTEVINDELESNDLLLRQLEVSSKGLQLVIEPRP